MAEHIPLTPVESAAIAAIGHNPDKNILAIQFKSGSIRHYAGFSVEAFEAMAQAESIGQYFHTKIKNRYQVEQMTGECSKCGALGWIGETCGDCGCATYAPGVSQ